MSTLFSVEKQQGVEVINVDPEIIDVDPEIIDVDNGDASPASDLTDSRTGHGTEVIDVGGNPCPICLQGLPNGADIVLLGCGRGHFMCSECHQRNLEAEQQRAAMTITQVVDGLGYVPSDIDQELIQRRFSQGEGICPLCRGVYSCCIVAQAMSYK